MARLLLAAMPIYGHVRPLAQIATALRVNGHDVTFLVGTTVDSAVEPTASRFPSDAHQASPVRRTALGHRDYVRSGSHTSLRRALGRRFGDSRPRWIRGRDEVLDTFMAPLRAQAETLFGMVNRSGSRRFDAIVADASFLGVQPLLLTTSRPFRPPVIGISVAPIMLRSLDCAPFGAALLPRDGPIGERRNRQTEWLLRNGPLRPVRRAADAVAAEWDIGPGQLDLFDAIARFDRVFHLGLPELEYPRRELPPSVEFVGPLPAGCTCGGRDHPVVDVGHHVVHITQGTLDNLDVNRLLLPSIRALAGGCATVIACTGRTRTKDIGRLFCDDPGLRVLDFVCYAWLLPRLDLMITNGGYGAVQLAARHGIPLIVAGDTQDKAEVAARVRWSGIGVDLRTGRPRQRQIAAAVETIRNDRCYAQRAREVARAADQRGDPMDRIISGILAEI